MFDEREDDRFRRETHRRRPVIQQTFGLDNHAETAVGFHLLKRGDDRDRVGGGDQDSEKGPADPAPADDVMHRRRDEGRGDRDAGKGQSRGQW